MRVAVLAGGKSSRFEGEPKGLERVGGERILDRVVQTVQEAFNEPPLLVANDADASEWRAGLEIRRDPVPDCGSLGGLYAAVTAKPTPVLVVAWDMPFLTVDLLQQLVKGASSFDAYLPESDGPRGVEPFCAVYGPACAEPIRASLEAEDYRATGFHDKVRTGTLTISAVSQLGDTNTLFFNVNTKDDLSKAQEIWKSLHA